MKIKDYIDIDDKSRFGRWVNGDSIKDISRVDSVKDEAVMTSIGSSLKSAIDRVLVGSWHGDNVKVFVKEIDEMIKNYPYYNDSTLVCHNAGFLKKNGRDIIKVINNELSETGNYYYGAHLLYTGYYESDRQDILNNFLRNLMPNQELIDIHKEAPYIYDEYDHVDHVYAIIKSMELTIGK